MIRLRTSPATLAVLLVATPATAERPLLAGEATFGGAAGEVLVHYATGGDDAVPVLDANTDGIPDFVAQVARVAEDALGHYGALGFRRPLDDGTLGGDARLDIYLRDLTSADGSAVADSCAAAQCAGHIIAENDFVGFSYPSVADGIRTVVAHEMFHLVQLAYSMDQPSIWTEGTAVWAVEHLFGDDNDDFERFLPAFLTRTYRPLERGGGGFGDAYPYGAALWPRFLEERYGAGAVVASWTACEALPFLEAIDEALRASGTELDAAWREFTRWNALTGAHAVPAEGYLEARSWLAAPREPLVDREATVYVEGLSARYVPVALAERSLVTVTPTGGIHTAAWILAEGGGLAAGVELAADGEGLAAELDPGAYTLVVTGLSRGTITTPVELVVTEPPAVADAPGGGCAASASTGPHGLLLLALLRCLRRKVRPSPSRASGSGTMRAWADSRSPR